MISRSLPRPLLRVLPHPVLSVLLLLVWLLLVDSFAIGHWLLGAFLGVCIPLLTNRLLVGRSQEWHPLLLLKLLVLVMWDILVANVQVARLTSDRSSACVRPSSRCRSSWRTTSPSACW